MNEINKIKDIILIKLFLYTITINDFLSKVDFNFNFNCIPNALC